MLLRTLIGVVLLCLSLKVTAKEQTGKQQVAVASINLCADQLVLLLADDDQIRSLSNLSHQEAGSYLSLIHI